MEVCRGESSTPSYKYAMANRGKSHLSNVKGSVEEESRNKEKETDGAESKKNSNTKDKEEEDKTRGKIRKKNKRDHVGPKWKSLRE